MKGDVPIAADCRVQHGVRDKLRILHSIIEGGDNGNRFKKQRK